MRKRIKKGKEDSQRIGEKFGNTKVDRPDADIVWFHALSVGESLALLPLLERAGTDLPNTYFLLTTSTRASAQALEKIGLPDRVIHQYLPVDTIDATQRFLNYWKPKAAIFAELDFWPAVMSQVAKRNIPMLLINSRMSDKNFLKRQKIHGLFSDVMAMFDVCILQDSQTKTHLKSFGVPDVKIHVLGTLKSAAKPLPADEKELKILTAQIKGRPVWLAAATDPREEETLLRVHKTVTEAIPNALMILAPRYLNKTIATVTLANQMFKNVSRRSNGETLGPRTEIYIADTMGEMGLWYRLCPVSFIAHSLQLPDVQLRGKNPFEAAALKSVILHGPQTIDFSETYRALDDIGGAILVRTEEEISDAIINAQNDAWAEKYIQKATKITKEKQDVLAKTWDLIHHYL